MIEESIEDILKLDAHEPIKMPSYRGEAYDRGYAQGRKDACRVILLSFGRTHVNSVEVKDARERKDG